MENFSETLYPRHELTDYQRTGCNIYVAPSPYQLAAITDSLNRITLVNTVTGLTVRMWKGYREASCGFMEITETKNRKEENSDSRRSGVFLIIYAPRKAILEIWCLQNGPKVATFQASKNGFLIYNNKSKSSRAECWFFDAADNSLKTFTIPFHCILSETNSKNAEDFHHLKRLKMSLKTIDLKDPSGISGIVELCERFHTPEIKLKCLELVTSYKKTEPVIISKVIEIFLKSPNRDLQSVKQDEETAHDEVYRNQLSASCQNYQSLVSCYNLSRQSFEEKGSSEEVQNESIELLDNEYLTVQRIVELMSFSKAKETISGMRNVSFKDMEDSIVPFLNSFIVNNTDLIIMNTENHQSVFEVGSVLFTNAWKEQIPISKLLDIFTISRIPNEDIMKCFLHFWLHQEINFSDEDHALAEMTKFKNILNQVCLSAADKVTYAYNSICIFWQNVREYLLESNNPINSLIAAIICKNYALKKQDESQDFGFEQVTQEECQVTTLCAEI